MTQHQNFSTSHYVFDCVDSCKSFLSFKLSSFLFLSLKLSFWFLQFIEVIVYTSDDRKSFNRRLKFSYLFIRTKYISVYSHYLSASVVIFIVCIYINLYLFLWFFFMSQCICTRCAHNYLIYEFLNSNSTYVLNLCSSLFIDLFVYSYTLYALYMLHNIC